MNAPVETYPFLPPMETDSLERAMDGAIKKSQTLGRKVFDAFLKSYAGFREAPPRQRWAMYQEMPTEVQLQSLMSMAMPQPAMDEMGMPVETPARLPQLAPLVEQLIAEPTFLNLLRCFEQLDPEEAAWLATDYLKLEKDYNAGLQSTNGNVA